MTHDADALDAITVACFESFAALPSGRVIAAGGLRGAVSGVPLPFFNGIATTAIEGDPGNTIDDVMTAFRDAGLPFRWWISPSTRPRDLSSHLLGRGFRHAYDAMGMVAKLGDADLDREQDVDIAIVEDAATMHTWTRILLTVFQRPEEEIAPWGGAFVSLGLRTSPWTHFLATDGGRPIATASVLVAGDLAGIYNVATASDARGRGVGEAITREAMRFGREAGATRAVLQSSEMAAGIYRRIGFRDVAMLNLYDWRPR